MGWGKSGHISHRHWSPHMALGMSQPGPAQPQERGLGAVGVREQAAPGGAILDLQCLDLPPSTQLCLHLTPIPPSPPKKNKGFGSSLLAPGQPTLSAGRNGAGTPSCVGDGATSQPCARGGTQPHRRRSSPCPQRGHEGFGQRVGQTRGGWGSIRLAVPRDGTSIPEAKPGAGEGSGLAHNARYSPSVTS